MIRAQGAFARAAGNCGSGGWRPPGESDAVAASSQASSQASIALRAAGATQRPQRQTLCNVVLVVVVLHCHVKSSTKLPLQSVLCHEYDLSADSSVNTLDKRPINF